MDAHIPTVEEIAARVGGIAALARAAGVDRTTPYSWRRIPAERVAAVSVATGISIAELRPDLAAAFAPAESLPEVTAQLAAFHREHG